jgi:hypothetical protein
MNHQYDNSASVAPAGMSMVMIPREFRRRSPETLGIGLVSCRRRAAACGAARGRREHEPVQPGLECPLALGRRNARSRLGRADKTVGLWTLGDILAEDTDGPLAGLRVDHQYLLEIVEVVPPMGRGRLRVGAVENPRVMLDTGRRDQRQVEIVDYQASRVERRRGIVPGQRDLELARAGGDSERPGLLVGVVDALRAPVRAVGEFAVAGPLEIDQRLRVDQPVAVDVVGAGVALVPRRVREHGLHQRRHRTLV